MNDGATIRIRRPCEADTRRNVIETGIDAAVRYALVTRNQHALRKAGCDRGLRAGHELHRHQLSVGRRGLDVVPDTEVQRQVGPHAPVVLREETIVEVVRIGIHRHVLPHRVRRAEQKVGNGRRGTVRDIGVCRELEYAVVVQRSLLRIVFTTRFAAEVQRMPATSSADDVSDRIQIGARDWTCNCVACREPASDLQLRT